jgi:hypothetical protein
MQSNINLSNDAAKVIEALQHKNGTFRYYHSALTSLSRYILQQSDEIGMSDTEALATLRVLDAIDSDLATIAGPVAAESSETETQEEVAARIDATFSDIEVFQEPGCENDTDKPAVIHPDDEPNS